MGMSRCLRFKIMAFVSVGKSIYRALLVGFSLFFSFQAVAKTPCKILLAAPGTQQMGSVVQLTFRATSGSSDQSIDTIFIGRVNDRMSIGEKGDSFYFWSPDEGRMFILSEDEVQWPKDSELPARISVARQNGPTCSVYGPMNCMDQMKELGRLGERHGTIEWTEEQRNQFLKWARRNLKNHALGYEQQAIRIVNYFRTIGLGASFSKSFLKLDAHLESGKVALIMMGSRQSKIEYHPVLDGLVQSSFSRSTIVPGNRHGSLHTIAIIGRVRIPDTYIDHYIVVDSAGGFLKVLPYEQVQQNAVKIILVGPTPTEPSLVQRLFKKLGWN